MKLEENRNAKTSKGSSKSKSKGKKAVLGVVADSAAANRIVEEFQRAGFRYEDISAIFSDKKASRDFAHEKSTKAPEGAATGAGVGGVVGGTLGLLAGLGLLAIPGLGPLIAAGPIMAALTGLGAGAAVGGLSGGLVGLGVPEYNAKIYEAKVKEGNVLIAVHVDDSSWSKKAKKIFEATNATDVAEVSESGSSSDGSEAREQLGAKIHENMPVVGTEGSQIGVVDHMEGEYAIKLNRDASGVHHYIPLAWVTTVDDKVHVDRTGVRATRDWSTAPPPRFQS